MGFYPEWLDDFIGRYTNQFCYINGAEMVDILSKKGASSLQLTFCVGYRDSAVINAGHAAGHSMALAHLHGTS